MKIKLFFFIIPLIVFSCKSPVESSKISEGTIKYDITYMENNTSNYSDNMLPGKMITKFKGSNSINKIDGFFNFFSITNYINSRNRKSVTLLKVINNKYIYEGKKNEQSCCFNDYDNVEIEYINETKKIAGYDCYKALIHYTGSDKKTLEIYYTQDIKLTNTNWATPYTESVEGVLMEFYLEFSKVTMKLTAKEVLATTIDDKEFETPNKDYTLVTRASMEKLLDRLMK